MSPSRPLHTWPGKVYYHQVTLFGDRQIILQSARALRDTGVYINEDFSSETKTNRKALYPVLKAARDKAIYKDKVSIHVDRLVLNGKTYTINNLDTHPADLNPGHLATNDSVPGLIRFFGSASHFNNFHPSPFTIDGIRYINNEQYHQSMKSEEFCDDANAAEIMSSSDPLKMYILGNKVKNFNENTWLQKCDDIMLKGLWLSSDQT